MEPPGRQPTQHIQCVDLVRTLAILTVMAIHLGKSGNAFHVGVPWADHLWRQLDSNGSYGVSVFFVVSGFLITRVLANQPGGAFQPMLRNFYIRRAARLWPLLALLVVGGAAMMWTTSGEPSPAMKFCFWEPKALFDWNFWLSIPTFTFNWLRVKRESISGSYGLIWDIQWSLAVEEQFYLCYPLLLRWAATERRLYKALAAIILSGVLFRCGVWWFDGSFLLSFTASPACFDQIALGCLLYFISARARPFLEEERAISLLLCLLGLLMMGTIYVYMDLWVPAMRVMGPTLLGIGVFLFLLGGIHLKGLQSRWWRPLTFPGELSYGCYLLHGVTLYFLWPYLPGLHKFKAFGLYVMVTVAVSYLTFTLIEMPAARAIRKRFELR